MSASRLSVEMAATHDGIPAVFSNSKGTSCYINATLHMLFASKRITALLLSSMVSTRTEEKSKHSSKKPQDGEKLLCAVLQTTLQKVPMKGNVPIKPTAFLQKPFWLNVQADVSEFLQQILNSSECVSASVEALMQSTIEHRKQCEVCKHDC